MKTLKYFVARNSSSTETRRYANEFTIPESHDETINLTLHDIAGRIVQDFNFTTNEGNSLSLNLNDIKSGIYFIKAKSKNHTTTKKLTVIR